ncbi:MAG: alpha/beta hydrolase [Clostridia bacterium]|nr:alpha/beta hydrolase [Clostridia bacterium]
MGKHKLLTESERLENKKQVRPKKKLPLKVLIPIVSVSVVIILLITWVSACAYTAHSLLNPERKGLLLDDGPLELNMVYSTFDIPGLNEGDQLICWWIPSQDYMAEEVPSNKTVVVSHNYGSNREMIEISAIHLIDHIVHEGYNVVMFDYSGSGNAEGKNYTFGHEEAEELSIVVDYIKESYEQDYMAVLGWGFGAAAAIAAGSENDNVSCIIADGSYLNLREYLEENLSVWSYLPDGIFTPLTLKFMELMSGCDFSLSPYEAVKTAEGKSFLFLHGMDDYIFPYENSNIMFELAGEKNFSDVALFKSRHIFGFMDYETNYTNEILYFLQDHFGPEIVEESAE